MHQAHSPMAPATSQPGIWTAQPTTVRTRRSMKVAPVEIPPALAIAPDAPMSTTSCAMRKPAGTTTLVAEIMLDPTKNVAGIRDGGRCGCAAQLYPRDRGHDRRPDFPAHQFSTVRA